MEYYRIERSRMACETRVPPGIRDCGEQIRQKAFEDFVGKANILTTVSCQPVFVHLILSEMKKHTSPVVLDIGCGKGIGAKVEYQEQIKGEASAYWGIEPDTRIFPREGLFDNFEHAMLEDAHLPSSHFDVVYATFVMEHVQKPEAFLGTIRRILKPGGSFLFMTPNGAAFFGWMSSFVHHIRLERSILHWLKRSPEIDAEHYPLSNRCNTRRSITHLASQTGLHKPDLAYFQFDGTQGYFPGPLRIFYHALLAKRRLLGNPDSLDTVICRLTA